MISAQSKYFSDTVFLGLGVRYIILFGTEYYTIYILLQLSHYQSSLSMGYLPKLYFYLAFYAGWSIPLVYV